MPDHDRARLAARLYRLPSGEFSAGSLLGKSCSGDPAGKSARRFRISARAAGISARPKNALRACARHFLARLNATATGAACYTQRRARIYFSKRRASRVTVAGFFDWLRQFDVLGAALALTWGYWVAWGFWVASAILGISAYRARGRTIRGLIAQLRGVRFEAAKTQVLPDWLLLRRDTIVGGSLPRLPRFKLPAERAPQPDRGPVDFDGCLTTTLPAVEHPDNLPPVGELF